MCYVALDPACGYAQGMNDLASPLLGAHAPADDPWRHADRRPACRQWSSAIP